MVNKKQLTHIFVLSTVVILIFLGVAALVIEKKDKTEVQEGPVIMQVADEPDPELIEIATVLHDAMEKEPLPEGVCTLLVNRNPEFTLASEEQIRVLLNEYLAICASAPDGERLLSATYECELIIVAAAEDAIMSDYNDVFDLLLACETDILPIRMITESISGNSIPIETISTTDRALAKKHRIIKQWGVAGYTTTQMQRSYVGGILVEETLSEELERHEGRALLIHVGTWMSKGSAPGRTEGEKVKSAGDIKLQLPVRGSILSYFGMYEGKMHNGIDIAANAGTTVIAPGEGIIVYCGERGTFGFVIDINHGNGFVSRVTHLDPASVQIEYNQRVFAGEPIGLLLASSSDKKTHLHYELLVDSVPCNPFLYIH